jgi:ankyrin repeat protein
VLTVIYILAAAVEGGHATVVRELLSAGRADVHACDADARTALHFAAIDGSLECVQRLLAADAKVLGASSRRWSAWRGNERWRGRRNRSQP